MHFTPDSNYVIYGANSPAAEPMVHNLRDGAHYAAAFIDNYAPEADRAMLHRFAWGGNEGLGVRHSRDGDSLSYEELRARFPQHIINGSTYALGIM